MWSFEILNIDIYHLLSWFYIYSFLGWVWESSYVSIKSGKLVNRGFITGPLCTIYGCGAVIVYLLARPFSGNLITLFLAGMILATVLEYITAVIMESLFHTSWWNYSKNKFNFQGRICLGASLGWGVFTVILFYIFQPFVSFIVELYPRKVGEIGIIVVTVLYLIDFTTATIAASNLHQKLSGLEGVLDEVSDYFKTTKLYESAEEIRERMDVYKKHMHTKKWSKKAEESYQKLSARLSERGWIGESKEELEKKIVELNKKYWAMKDKMDFVSKRFMNAYPNLLTSAKKKEDQKNQKKEEE